MIKKLVSKIIASMLVLIMLLAYTATIGIYAEKIYAVENSLEVQGVKTNNENVEFDAYFVNGKSKTHEFESKIGEDSNIYLEISVKNAGYLKNAKVEFTGNEKNDNANFLVKELTRASKFVTAVNTNENKIELNQINKNEQANIQIPICFDSKDKISLAQFSKENTAKLTGTYVDANGKEKQIKAEIKIKLDWSQNLEIALEEQIVKYVPYTLGNQKGVMLQTVVKSSVLNNSMPVKEENIEITVPTIANTKPTSVEVAANTTNGTNGDINAINFTKEQYTYDIATGKITIKVENKEDEQGNVAWNKNTQDEFLVTYLYPQGILNNMPQEGNKVKLETKANITTYGKQENTLTKTITSEATLKDAISSIVNIEVTTNVEELSKGYIYANYEAEEKIETEYKETIITNIGSSILTNNVVLYSNVDNFIKDENTKGSTTVNNTNYAYIKELKIEKEIYDKFIGEEGYINLYQGTTLISTINKDTKANEDKNIVIDLSKFDINSLTIMTSKPLIEGNLKIEITKALKGNIAYNKNQMREFTALEVVVAGKAINNGIIFDEQTANKNINFTEPKTTAEITISNTNLSTVVTNKDVEIRAILKTNSLEYNLYKNPSLTITMPSYIESINVKNVQVLFNDELKIKTANLMQNADGTKSIVIELQGTQTKYDIGNIAGGANIVITADINVNKLTPNTVSEIRMNYTNENTMQKETTRMKARTVTVPVEQNETVTKVSFTAPTGIVTMNGVAGYKDGAEELTSISGEEKIAEIEIMAAKREATFNMSVMNNYNNTIENVVILGRTPFAGNKAIETKEDLGSTMDLNLSSAISVAGVDKSKVTIYYSENGEASKDLSLASNGWTQTITDLSKVKSYLIVLNNHVMNTADSVTFSYNAYIPENLQHNQSAYQTYAVYFTNNLEAGIVQDKQEAAKVGVTTGQGPVLEASITSNVEEGKYTLSGNLIKYTVTVKNTGDMEANNVIAKITKPVYYLRAVQMIDEEKGTYSYIKEDILENNPYNEINCEVGNIKPGETANKEIWLEVQRITLADDFCKDESHYITEESEYGTVEDPDERKTITYHDPNIIHDLNDYKIETTLKTVLTIDNLEKEIKINDIKSNIKNSFFSLKTEMTMNDMQYLEEKEEFIYTVNTYSYENTEKPILQVHIPKELEYEKVTNRGKFENGEVSEKEIESSRISYDKNTGILKININENKQNLETLNIYLKVKQTEEKVYTKEITLKSSITATNVETEYSNTLKATIIKNALKITQTSNIPEGSNIENNEEYQYKLLIESKGEKTGKSIYIDLIDNLPEEVTFVKAIQKGQDGKEEQLAGYVQDDNSVKMSTSVNEGETKEVTIYVKAKTQDTDTKITNKIEAYINENEKIEVNTISHTIKAIDIDNIKPDDQITKKISGQVWIDENKDGIKDEDEDLISGIQVMLLNTATGNLVTDADKNVLKEVTDENGNYTFKGIPQGKYTVIFLYDTANYSSTSYKKEGIDETKNSDAIDTQITLDGVKKTAAITEEITISDSNIYNIDLGLVVNPKFDLKLDKTVSKITVQDNTGTKTYNYEDTKLAKRDLVGKQISSTTIVVEYKIKVTNEGAVSGYVKKIADYLPTELKFSSELNKDWYQGDNGAIYNASLANTLINPGETKEVTLLLTKKLSEENIGLIHNSAEIYEAYNDLGLEDIDSTPGNKQTDEDDISSADVLLTVKTGETILFIGLSLTIISTIAISAYVIKRKILK